MTNNQNFNDLEQLKESWKQDEEKLFNELDNDEFAKESDTKAGTPENLEVKKLVNEAVEINSTKRVNKDIFWLKVFGVFGSILGIFVKTTSIQFDIKYHFPTILDMIDEFYLSLIGLIGALLITGALHLFGRAMLNTKWSFSNRVILGAFFVFFIIGAFYLDWVAVKNYSKVFAEQNRVKLIDNDNSLLGAKNNLIASKSNIINSSIKSLTTQKDQLNKSIEANNKMITKVNESIEVVKAKKLHTSSRKRIAQLNQNIYTSRKQLEQLENNNNLLFSKVKEIDTKINDEIKKLDMLGEDKQKVLLASDSKALLEKSKRESFFIAMVIFIELLSNSYLLAEIMNIRNIKKRKLIQLAEEQQTHKDIMGAVEHIMNVNIANDIKGLTKKGEMYNTMSKMQTINSLSQMSNQVETTKQNIVMLGRVNNIVRDTNKEAMESVQHQLDAIKANRENAQLKLLLSEAMKND